MSNKPFDPLALDNQFCFALYSTSLAMTKMYKPLLAKIGLTYPQYLVMLVLWQEDGLSVNQIGEKLFLDSGTLTPLLKRIEATGFIKRQRSMEDERQVTISLTPIGQELKSKAQEIPLQIMCASGLQPEALLNLRSQLNDVRGALHAHLATN